MDGFPKMHSQVKVFKLIIEIIIGVLNIINKKTGSNCTSQLTYWSNHAQILDQVYGHREDRYPKSQITALNLN